MTLATLMSSAKHDWQTPDCVLDRVRRIAPIGLDPCTVDSNPVGADEWICPPADGLVVPWGERGLVFCNPPYGRALPAWSAKIADEARAGVEIVALVPARTDTKWFNALFEIARGWCFWRGRLTFRGAPHPAPFPSALLYYGYKRAAFHKAFAGAGMTDLAWAGY